MVWPVIQAVLGGAFGKGLGKLIERIPGREESIRNKLDKLRKERDEIVREGIPSNRYKRYVDILSELRKLEKTLQNR